MKYRIHKAFFWLMMTLMILFGVVGCGSNMTSEEKAQALQAAGEVVEAMLEAAEATDDEREAAQDTRTEQTTAAGKASETEQITDAGKASETEQTTDVGKASETEQTTASDKTTEPEQVAHTDELDEHGSYTSKDAVAAYIHTYGHLPDNYITKRDAEELGWNSKEGNLWEVAPGKSIGGSKFGNYEGLLPEKKGRKYFECDIDYEGGYRGAKRIIYSNDGLIFYTDDHYESFEQLY